MYNKLPNAGLKKLYEIKTKQLPPTITAFLDRLSMGYLH